MPVQAPDIVDRSFNDIVLQMERLLQRYSGWQPAVDGSDSGQALVRVFARLAELVIARVNQVPDKNFLAFLDLLGIELLPPQPARAPLTFQLAAGTTTDALVPARTLVAAIPIEGETEPVIFETERELVVTRSQLTAAFTREPSRDRFSNRTVIATGQASGAFPVFQAEQPIQRRLYLGSGLFAIDVPKKIKLYFDTGGAATPAEPSWLSAITWALWDGAGGQPLASSLSLAPGAGVVTLSDIPRIPPVTVAGRTISWLSGLLNTSLPRGELVEVDRGAARYTLRQPELAPAAGFADMVPLDFSHEFYPFGQAAPHPVFYLACDEAFSKPGADVTITVNVNAAQPARPSADLILAWEFWNKASWQEIGRSSPMDSSIGATGAASGFNDETLAFTNDGIIRFRCPGNWAPNQVKNTAGFWLRARIVSGNFGQASDYRPPAVQQLSMAYEWPLPLINGIQAAVEISRTDLLPDLVFTNQLPVDPTKDFFPFGEKPKFRDTLYLASAETFSRPNANVTLTVTLTNPSDEKVSPVPAVPRDNLTLTWEFWNCKAGRWEFLGVSGMDIPQNDPRNAKYHFNDQTEAFVKEGQITFKCPETSGPVEVNGSIQTWIRVRIAKGNYGHEAEYQPKDPKDLSQGYQLIQADFKPPSIKKLTLGYDYTSPAAPLEVMLAENDFAITELAQTGGESFCPFQLSDDTQPTFYLGFQRTGADTGFANRSTALYFQVADILYSRSPADGRTVEEPAAVVWEYWNGSRWGRLGTRDETRGFTNRGLVIFIGPSDFRRSTEFGSEAFWLRARWDRGGYRIPPQLQEVLTNTMWASHTRTILNENLGSSSGQQSQVFRTAKAPVLPGQRIEVREPELPSTAERAVIEDEEGDAADSPVTTQLDASGRPVEIWVRWHQVPDFYESGPRSRHYTLDRLTGEIQFGDGQYGLVPPQGRANIRAARYQTGGGPQGNRPSGAIMQLKSAVPYIDRVTNWEPSSGGSAQETLENVKIRGPKTLRHSNRAVAIADFEDLALEASTDIARVKGIAAQDNQDAGSVGLIIVPRSSDPQPIPTLELLGRVKDYIETRLTPTVEVWVAGPDWLEVTVSAEIVPVSLEEAADIQAAILARLAGFLHPLTGGPDRQGWAFGRKPYRSDLYALIEGTPGVDHIRFLIVTEEGEVSPSRFLVYSGVHQVTLVSGLDEFADR